MSNIEKRCRLKNNMILTNFKTLTIDYDFKRQKKYVQRTPACRRLDCWRWCHRLTHACVSLPPEMTRKEISWKQSAKNHSHTRDLMCFCLIFCLSVLLAVCPKYFFTHRKPIILSKPDKTKNSALPNARNAIICNLDDRRQQEIDHTCVLKCVFGCWWQAGAAPTLRMCGPALSPLSM